MPDRIVITATALALAEPSLPIAGPGTASDTQIILRLPDEPTDRRHTSLSQRLSRLIGELAARGGLAPQDLAGPQTGLVSGSRYGCSLVNDMHSRLRVSGPRGIDAVGFAQATHNFPLSICAIEYGIKGPGVALVSSAAAGMEALNCGRDWLQEGRCDRVIVIAYEDLRGAAADHLARVAQPEAPPVHEGMALLLLERASLAEARGAAPLAELIGTAILPAEGEGDATRAIAHAFGSPPDPCAVLLAQTKGATPPLVDCLAVGGLLAVIRATETTEAGAWLVGAVDPGCGGVAAGLRRAPQEMRL